MFLRYAAIGLAIAGATCPAFAISITNNDDKDHTLTVIEGDAKQPQILKPAAKLDGVCLRGCILRIGDSENDTYELEGNEIVSIEDGYLYYDGPETGAEPALGAKFQPPPATPPGTDPKPSR